MLSVYKASAGSGKTYTLALHYIKLLLGVKIEGTQKYRLNTSKRDRHRHILAITFTNKATDEMKRRIIHELAHLGGLEPGWNHAESPYLKDLCDAFSCTPLQLRDAAATALKQLLLDFNFFQVSTIDSFFQIVLRTFAREVDIAGNYEVDLDNDRAIGYGVHELFDSLTIDSGSPQTRQLLIWITQYLLQELDNGHQISLFNRKSKVYSDFLKFIKSISNDDFAENYNEMMEFLADPHRLSDLAKEIAKAIEVMTAEVKQLCRDALKGIADRDYDYVAGKKISINNNLYNQLVDIAEVGYEKGERVSAANTLNDISKAYSSGLRKQLDKTPDPRLDNMLMRACEKIVEYSPEVKLLKVVGDNIFVLGLLERVFHHIDNYRNENNTIFLSDTNSLLRDIIGGEDDNCAPFVYERVGVWLNHYLIDEFQDTSKIQWQNLLPLLREGQGSDNDSLIIGDEKQCIYRFRFSDPSILQSGVQEKFRDSSQLIGNTVSGNTNWRSSADVVRFNNELFSRLSAMVKFDDIYSNVCQAVSPKHIDHRGYVKLTKISDVADDEMKEVALASMLDDIRRQLRAGYRPCDIAILTRFNKEARDVISYLMRLIKDECYDELRGVRIMSDDAMEVASAPAVRLIISVMRYLVMPQGSLDDEPADNGNRRKALRREIGKLTNSVEHMCSNGVPVEKALEKAIRAMNHDDECDLFDVDEQIVASMACFNLPSLVENIISSMISSQMAQQQNMYISAFVDVVTDFCSRGNTDVDSFLRWWDETGYRSKISAPLDERAIRVMSIHKSKGLEFDCVHIPFANWNMIEFKSLEWFDTGGKLPCVDERFVPKMIPLRPSKRLVNTQFEEQYTRRCREQLLDELNAFYVALTRAGCELSICCTTKGGGKDASPVCDLLCRAAADMDLDSSSASIEYRQGDSNCECSLEILSSGAPTVPLKASEKPPTALDPGESSAMPLYRSAMRGDLWDTLDIDSYLDYGKSRERGIILHDVLARVRHRDDLAKAVAYCAYHGRLPQDEADNVARHLSAALAKTEVSGWFEGFEKAVCERPMTLANGDVARADRIVWTADGFVDVIDYKFGEEREEKYSRQLRKYMTALRRMGYDNVRGFIWYVDSGVITPVD